MVFLFINLLLPNINGQTVSVSGWSQGGAFESVETTMTGGTGDTGLTRVRVYFNASKSNSTYVNNGTIRPNSLSVLVLIRI